MGAVRGLRRGGKETVRLSVHGFVVPVYFTCQRCICPPERGGAEAAEILIACVGGKDPRLTHVRSCPIHPRAAKRRDIQRVQRVRIAGADDLLRVKPGLLRRGRYAAHEAGFARARPTLDYTQKYPAPLRETVIERIKAPAGICRKEKHGIHTCTP